MNKKGLIVVLFFGGIMVSSGFGLSSMMTPPPEDVSELTVTGTPADNFPDEQRSQFCGSGNATSTNFVQEFSIPTVCTLPQAIITDPQGNIWFVESNTGNLAKFDPVLESFTEYENSLWPKSEHSMMWGMDYAPDGTIWFTEEKYNSVWKFDIQDEEYHRIPFQSEDNSFPQQLEIQGSKLIINDFKGNKIVFSDYTEYEFKSPSLPISTDLKKSDEELQSDFSSPDDSLYSYSLPSVNPRAVTADFTIDDEILWYTSWVLDGPGILYKD